MKKLPILLIVLFFISCESAPNDRVLPTEPQTSLSNEHQEVIFARMAAEDKTYHIVFEGSVSNNPSDPDFWWLVRVKKGSKNIWHEGGTTVDLTFTDVFNCLPNGDYPGILGIGQPSKKNNPALARAQFWFHAPGVEPDSELMYILVMDGTFSDEGANWPPAEIDDEITLTLTTWYLNTKGEGNPKKYKATPCSLYPIPGDITVTVTRTE
jgi:hypothetical protein